MRWDRLFEDLQDQFASEWESERVALDTEAERLRVARLTLRTRLHSLAEPPAAPVSVEFHGTDALTARLTAVGEDWAGFDLESGGAGVARLDAVTAVAVEAADLLRSARAEPGARPTLAERMGFGFLMRDLARRRLGVVVHRSGGPALSGTVDRAGADHLDLALHDARSPRRADEVTGLRMIPFAAIAWVALIDRDGTILRR